MFPKWAKRQLAALRSTSVREASSMCCRVLGCRRDCHAALADARYDHTAIAPDAFHVLSNEKYAADIMFLLSIRRIYWLTSSTQTQCRTAASDPAKPMPTNRAKSRRQHFILASPDGTMEFNTRLAETARRTPKANMNDQLRKDKITEFGELTSTVHL